MFTLYRLYGKSGELLYIGKTIDRFRRLDTHCRRQPWAAEINNIRFDDTYFADDAALSSAEISAIRTERPKYNKVHNARPCLMVTPDDDEGERVSVRMRTRNMSATWKATALSIRQLLT
jgi:hypothetical protein